MSNSSFFVISLSKVYVIFGWILSSISSMLIWSKLNHLCYLVFISPWKRMGPFICTNVNSLYPRMHCAKFGWNWPSGSGERRIFIFVNVFLLFGYYLPLEKNGAFYLNKLDSSSPKNALCKVWLKLARLFGKGRFYKFRQCIFAIW